MENVPINRDYALFFMICGDPTDLLRTTALGNWRTKCKTAVCLIDELWVKKMAAYQNFLKILDKFDVVMLYYSQTAEPLSKRIGRKCVYMPPGVDAIRFCPYPQSPKRVVDVYSIGRRSEKTHQTLLKMAAEQGVFYLHDSIAANQVLEPTEHRILFANIAKRSRYFIVNPGLIDRPDVRGSQMEIGNRYFEAAASGMIMLGERPRNVEFEKLFDWPDALVHVSYESSGIDSIIHEFDQESERQEVLRRTSVSESLMRHDWAHRWETVLGLAGLEPMHRLCERKEHLSTLARTVVQDTRPVLNL
jgi:spore maturation protein CgeB